MKRTPKIPVMALKLRHSPKQTDDCNNARAMTDGSEKGLFNDYCDCGHVLSSIKKSNREVKSIPGIHAGNAAYKAGKTGGSRKGANRRSHM